MYGEPHQISRDPVAPGFVSEQEILLYLTASPPEGRQTQLNWIEGNCTLHISGTDRSSATINQAILAAVKLRILAPTGNEATFPANLYTQDTGWIFRDVHTHGHCVRLLDLGAHTHVVSPARAGAAQTGFSKALSCGVS